MSIQSDLLVVDLVDQKAVPLVAVEEAAVVLVLLEVVTVVMVVKLVLIILILDQEMVDGLVDLLSIVVLLLQPLNLLDLLEMDMFH
tara:strand:- start:211 stop:468 length:258 start_codon:yes stop_codon:yes gene_type:complete